MTTYPRPDFQRTPLNWSSLDGPWTFTFDDTDSGKAEKWHKASLNNTSSKREIQVPYAFQTPASGINLYEAHEVMWYERTITDIRSADEKAKGNSLLVRFGAVDYECEVWVDGHFVGGHRGGHVPFDVDVSDAFGDSDGDGNEARLTLRVRDSPYDLTQPRGKQFWGPVPESIFYTPSGGIWLSVWLESVPAMRLACGSGGTVLRSDDVDGGVLHAQVGVLGRRVGSESAAKVEIEASLGGVFVSKGEVELPRDRNIATLDLSMKVPNTAELQSREPFNGVGVWHEDVALWAPEHPILYDITLRLYNSTGNVVDTVETTTGMRSLSWQTGDGTFRLNGKPYFQMLFLDQGYWPETGLTPPSSEALKTDIELAKKIGFNGCRKHQKVEDPRFYYWADRLGFVVWGEMANAYEFGGEYVERFTSEWIEAVKRDINHPSIITWTPVNESWAVSALKDNIEQRNHVRALYYLTKYDSIPSIYLLLPPTHTHTHIYICTSIRAKETNEQQKPRPKPPRKRQLWLGTCKNRPNNLPRLQRLPRTNNHMCHHGRNPRPKRRTRNVRTTHLRWLLWLRHPRRGRETYTRCAGHL
jgi:beta-galactosidase/beta-glucuronidase